MLIPEARCDELQYLRKAWIPFDFMEQGQVLRIFLRVIGLLEARVMGVAHLQQLRFRMSNRSLAELTHTNGTLLIQPVESKLHELDACLWMFIKDFLHRLITHLHRVADSHTIVVLTIDIWIQQGEELEVVIDYDISFFCEDPEDIPYLTILVMLSQIYGAMRYRMMPLLSNTITVCLIETLLTRAAATAAAQVAAGADFMIKELHTICRMVETDGVYAVLDAAPKVIIAIITHGGRLNAASAARKVQRTAICFSHAVAGPIQDTLLASMKKHLLVAVSIRELHLHAGMG